MMKLSFFLNFRNYCGNGVRNKPLYISDSNFIILLYYTLSNICSPLAIIKHCRKSWKPHACFSCVLFVQFSFDC